MALGLREDTGARKHEATFESLRAHRPSRPGFSRLKLFEKASDSAKLEEQAYAERIGRKEEMTMAKNIRTFLCSFFISKTCVASQWTHQVRLGRTNSQCYSLFNVHTPLMNYIPYFSS